MTKDILKLLAKGYTNAEIGAELGITSKTAANYVSALIQAFGAKNRLDLVIKAIKGGLVNVE